MKWKRFLPIWLVVFLLAPSIIFPQAFLTTKSSPDDPGLPDVIPFGAVHWAQEWGFLLERDGDRIHGKIEYVRDFFFNYFICILPILIYTFVVSLVIYYVFRYLFRKVRQKRREVLPIS